MQPAGKQPLRQFIKTLLKILFSAAALYWVSRQIQPEALREAWQKTQVWWTIPGLLLYVISKLVSSYRLNIYFRAAGLRISEALNLKLYWLGMFYNLFLPGGIGGDGYKIWWLQKHFRIRVKLAFQAVLLDRLSGMAALVFLAGCFAFFIAAIPLSAGWIAAGLVALIFLFYAGTRYMFPGFLGCILPTGMLGLLVQSIQVICMACLLYAVGVRGDFTGYLFLFLVSSAVAVLPLSVGGLGARELVFLYGSQLLVLDPGISVLVSLWFYLISVLSSLPGVIYVLKPGWLTEAEANPDALQDRPS